MADGRQVGRQLSESRRDSQTSTCPLSCSTPGDDSDFFSRQKKERSCGPRSNQELRRNKHWKVCPATPALRFSEMVACGLAANQSNMT
jgi:hypothetical protein